MQKRTSKQQVLQICPELDNLSPFIHPQTKTKFSWMSSLQLLELASKTVDQISKLGIHQVLVSESGAMPFARICKEIASQRSLHIRWYSIKVPREILPSLPVSLQYGLERTEEQWRICEGFSASAESFRIECSAKAKMIRTLVPQNYFESPHLLTQILHRDQLVPDFEHRAEVLQATQGSALSKILEKPFIYFDEYIDSGKTLFQTFRYLNLFGKNLSFRIFSYMVKLPKTSLPDYVTSLFDMDSEQEAYQQGIYPFENRIDWIGYFYVNRADSFARVSIADLAQSEKSTDHCAYELSELFHRIDAQNKISTVKRHCRVPEVSEFISKLHVFQYCLYLLEESTYGKTEASEFFFQVFDMYGPVWTPMPDEYHFSYWEAFERTRPELDILLSDPTIRGLYRFTREAWIHEIASLCENRRKLFIQSILQTVHQENKNEREF